jgi:hypothetical protein
MSKEALSLKEVQLKLGVQPHVLIHLCEKQVVVPDVGGANGRGSSRRFSSRNVFEFLVALTLRRYEIPVRVIGVVTRLLREFEIAVNRLETANKRPPFVLPDSLLDRNSPRVTLHFIDGELLVISLGTGRNRSCLAINAEKFLKDGGGKVTIERLDEVPETYETCLSVNLSKLATKLRS